MIRDSTPALWAPDPLAAVVAYIDYIDDFRGDRGAAIDSAPIISFQTWRGSLGDVPVLVTVGNPLARKMLAERVHAAGGRFAPPCGITSPAARDVIMGEGHRDYGVRLSRRVDRHRPPRADHAARVDRRRMRDRRLHDDLSECARARSSPETRPRELRSLVAGRRR